MTLKLIGPLAVIGALGLLLVGSLTASLAVTALGWSVVAAVGLATMLRGPGIRVLGWICMLLALGAAVAGGVAGGWAWLALLPSAVLVVAGAATARGGNHWSRPAGEGPREAPQDLWKQFDTGDDPTDPR